MKRSTVVTALGAPTWGTLVAGACATSLLIRMRTQYETADLISFAAVALLELALIGLLTWAAMAIRPVSVRVLSLALPAVLGTIYLAQIYSVWISGGLLPPLALANSEAAGFIAFRGFYMIVGAYLGCLVLGAVWPRSSRPAFPRVVPSAVVMVGLVVLYAGLVRDQPPPRGITVARGEAPISSFVRAVAALERPSADAVVLTAEQRAVRASFASGRVFERGFPEAITRSLPREPNILVVFIEGMSARWMETYGGVRPGLTPNLDRFAGDSLQFTNYYNHTAATIRGLRGQLTSGHQAYEGYTTLIGSDGRTSLPEIMHDNGYETFFFLSQQELLNSMISGLGFDHTFGRDALYDRYVDQPGRAGKRPPVLADPQLFSAVLNALKARHADGPFFAGVYNIDTHTFLDGRGTYGDGSNQVLNRFHTFDRDIGKFIRQFYASDLEKDTILVLTTDHSTYPDPEALDADRRTSAFFVEPIPLLIHWPGVEHRVIDARGKNSLDLAPSLLSLVNVDQAPNLFLGCTLFEECPLDRMSNWGSTYVLTDGTNSYPAVSLVPERLKGSYRDARRAIKRYKSMEMAAGATE